MERFTLRDLVLVVREDEVETATVNVEVFAEDRPRHRRALDVPAGPARPPGALPEGLPRLGLLPEGKVGSRSLPFGGRASLPLHGVDRAVGELAVIGVAGDVEIDVAVGGVGTVLRDQPLDEGDDRADVLGRLRHLVDRRHAESSEVVEVVAGHLLGEFGHRRAAGSALDDDLVVDVGDVHDPRHLPAGVDEVTLDGVEDHWADHVANVARLVDRRSTEIHPHLAGAHRLQRLLLPRERAVNLDLRQGLRRLGRRHGLSFACCSLAGLRLVRPRSAEQFNRARSTPHTPRRSRAPRRSAPPSHPSSP